MSDLHPDDKAKLDNFEADLNKLRHALKLSEKMIAGARVVAAPTWRNRYRYHRICEECEPLTAAFFATVCALSVRRR